MSPSIAPRNGRSVSVEKSSESGCSATFDAYAALRDLPDRIRRELLDVLSQHLGSIARALLLAGCPHTLAVKKALQHHHEAVEDYHRFARYTSLPEADARDLLARGNRNLARANKALALLGVSVRAPETGELFDPAIHTAREQRATADPDRHDRVADVLSPVYRWRDEFGNEQVESAQVVLHEYADPAVEVTEPEDVPSTD